MRTGRIVIVAGLAALLTTAAAHADATKKNAKFCGSLGDFKSDVAALRSIGPSSTIAELRTAAERVESGAQKLVKSAGKIDTPTAKKFTDSAKQLRTDAHSIPDTTTIEQAKSRVHGDVQNVERAARQLATESGCPEGATQPGTTPEGK
jgi:hypothetical protein